MLMIFRTALGMVDDSSTVGRIDKSSFTDQTLMDIILCGFDLQSPFRTTSGEFRDIEDMPNVDLDENRMVTSIRLFGTQLGGDLKMRWLPDKIRKFSVFKNGFTGLFDCALLPLETEIADFAHNRLIGSISLSDIPASLYYLDVSENQLKGTVDFQHLRAQIIVFDVSHNKLDGAIDVRHITKKIQPHGYSTPTLRLWAKYDIDAMQSEIWVDFSNNFFCGEVLVRDLQIIENLQIFYENRCTHVVDRNGTRKKLKSKR